MKVAILHPWFLIKGGAEKVVDVLAGMYPEADIFTLFADPAKLSPVLRNRKVYTSILNRVPLAMGLHRQLMPFYPLAVESFDLRAYDLIISSCGPAMMGCNIGENAVHICYCYTPQRSWWDLYADHRERLPFILRHCFTASASYVRTWEFCAMQRVDHVLANSNFIAGRISKYFRRQSTVIYPPVSTDHGPPKVGSGNYYLSVGRLEKEKRVDLLIKACNALQRRLLVVGTGKDEEYLRSLAGPTIEFPGYVADSDLESLHGDSRAFLFAADEDFGIAPVEAQSFGRPVIAYGHGGALETVRVDDPNGLPETGVFFSHQTVDSLVDAITRFEEIEGRFVPEAIQEHSRQFDTATFVTRMRNFASEALEGGQRQSTNLRSRAIEARM
jgi:glycosyltransferase involved in cell wall biosynthesis